MHQSILLAMRSSPRSPAISHRNKLIKRSLGTQPQTRPRPSEASDACSSTSRPTAGGLIPAARRPSLRLPGRLSSRAAQRHIHIRSSSIHPFIGPVHPLGQGKGEDRPTDMVCDQPLPAERSTNSIDRDRDRDWPAQRHMQR